MTAIDHGRLVRGLVPALLEAGRVEMAYFQGGVSVEHKSDRSPVTAADREAEACLFKHWVSCRRACPWSPRRKWLRPCP